MKSKVLHYHFATSLLTLFLMFGVCIVASAQEMDRDLIFENHVPRTQKENNYECWQWNKPRNYGSLKQIDSSMLTLTYDYQFKVADGDGLCTFKDMHILQIGRTFNRFYSAYSERVDSVAFTYLMSLKQEHIEALTPDWTPSRLKRTIYDWVPDDVYPLYQDVYRDNAKGRFTVSSRFQYGEYRYEEKEEKIDWKMTDGVDTVLGYVCNRAEATFRGRKWVAWYTFDIPFCHGPWKLGQLPGVILKVSDSENLFKWEAVGCAWQTHEPIYDHQPGFSTDRRIWNWIPDHKIIKCTRKEISMLWRRFWNEPLSIRLLNRESATFIGGDQRVELSLSDPVPDGWYPELETDLRR